jgi:hypothetical protein
MKVAITETGIELRPDHHRVVARLFVPGREDVGPGDSRASAVLDRILQLSDATCTARSELMPTNWRRTFRPTCRSPRHVAC